MKLSDNFVEHAFPAGDARVQLFPISTREIPLPAPLHTMGGPRGGTPLAVNVASPQEPFSAKSQPLRVLIVEDEAIIAMEIEMILEDYGAEVVGVAITAEEAERLAEIHRPDCATMDINIKGDRDGISAAIEIYANLGIRSIFVSAYGNDETKARARSAHPFGWVHKPIETAALNAMLSRVSDETA